MLATTAVAEPATTTATAAAATAFAAHSNPSIKPISVPPTFIPAFLSPLWGFPGFRFVIKYIQASYRNDPFRSFLELCLIVFVIWWTSRSKYKQGRNEVQLTEEEIDELVDDWKPEPLVPKLTECQRMSIAKIPTIEGPNGVN
ncbi:serine palmitoyltransferase component, partial [Spiromyces aspiralis]